MNRRLALLAVVVALVGGGVAVADLVPAPHRVERLSAAGGTLRVSAANLVCPDVGADRRTSLTTVGAASAPAPADRRAGSVTAEPLPPTGNGPHQLLKAAGAGALENLSAARNHGAVVTARGGPAAGLAAVQTTRTTSGPGRGMSTARCVAPAREWWFAGPTGWLGSYGSVFLTNAESTVALVDLELWGKDGPLNVPRAEGISVPPHERVVVPLSQLIPDQPNTVIHVVARTGRVAAAVSDYRHTGGRPDGIDWVPATTAPARDLVVPGMTSAVNIRKLVVGAPGQDDATVAIRVVGSSGAFVPTSLAKIAVEAGTVRTIDLTTVLAAEDVALEVTSDVPVVAAGLLYDRDGDTKYADVAWTAAVPALDGPGVIAQTRVRRGNETRLLLSAPRGAATVLVYALAPAPARPITVQVPAGRTVSVDVTRVLPPGARAGAVAVDPRTGSAPVYAARLIFEAGAHGPLFTMLPLTSTPRTAEIPPVLADIGAAYSSSP